MHGRPAGQAAGGWIAGHVAGATGEGRGVLSRARRPAVYQQGEGLSDGSALEGHGESRFLSRTVADMTSRAGLLLLLSQAPGPPGAAEAG